MTEHELQNRQEDESPVGDVRRVRERLSKQFGNDVRRLAEYVRQVGDQKARELGCEVIRKSSEPAKSSEG